VILPVAYFFVAPAIAQHLFDAAMLMIANSTMLPCDGGPHVELINNATLATWTPFPALLHGYNTSVSTYSCANGTLGGYACDNSTETLLGYYPAPPVHMWHGYNPVIQDAKLDLVDVDLLLMTFVLPLMSTPHHQVRLVLETTDATISVFGIPIKNLKFRKEMTCSYLNTSMVSPKPAYCGSPVSEGEPSKGRRLQNGFGPIMSCTFGFAKNLSSDTVVV